MAFVVALLCVLALSAGQILFKLGANSLATGSGYFSFQVLSPLVTAMFLYGIASIAWVWALQHIGLGRLYPLMALAFVIVPLASYFIFDEQLSRQYVVGMMLIVCGIIFSMRAS